MINIGDMGEADEIYHKKIVSLRWAWGSVGVPVLLLAYNNVPGHNTTFRTGPANGYKFLLLIPHIQSLHPALTFDVRTLHKFDSHNYVYII